MESNKFSLELPASGGSEIVTLECGQSVVIIGANGAGKTRLGTWIEFRTDYLRVVHRISAQKSLTMPEYSPTSSSEQAEDELRIGYWDQDKNNFFHYKNSQRWGQKPNTHLLNDFNQLMVFLFTEDYEKSSSHRRTLLSGQIVIPTPETKLDLIRRIWELIFPHRELKIGAGKIETHLKDSLSGFYNASEMSDGERVVFYLIGQALAAPENGIIIIDEPELHLHKSIQTTLWREIQAARPDCLFVYMTHDVEFAASLTEAKKIWLKSYDGSVWQWEEVQEVQGFPEELLLEVLGSRRPILFVEGENGSHDVALFQALYPDFAVFPRASCEQVILSTRALRQAVQFHHLHVHGIIDRDRRHDREIANLKRDGIEVLEVAEVENLFCIPEVLKLVAQHLELPVDETLHKARNFVLGRLKGELENQISSHVADEIKFRLNVFDTKKRGAEELKAELESRTRDINVDSIYEETRRQFEEVIQNQDYIGALKLFNRKGLSQELSSFFGIKKLPDFVLRMVQRAKPQEWTQAFTEYIPNLEK